MAHVSPHDSHSTSTLPTSTPPPSPPLTASRRSHAPKQFPAASQSNPPEQREGARPDSIPQTHSQPTHAADPRSQHSASELSPRGTPDAVMVAARAAAAAAAAASYTSHELAIAYSMVTSDAQQEEQQDRERAEQREEEEKRRQRRQQEHQNAKLRDQDPASHQSHPLPSRGRTYRQERVDFPQGFADSPPHAGYARQDGGDYHEDCREQEQRQEDGQQGYGKFEHGSGGSVQIDPGARSDSGRHGAHHPRIRSAPHSFPSQQQPHTRDQKHATVSHHPNALNRYPFSIPSISAKLDQPHPEDGSDALSSLWKKTAPLQEPYFRTRHTIASQHTLSTLGGVLFSLDEVPAEFNQDMYIAMRNRIFELEAKAVNYSPFSHSRKRSIDRSDPDDYPVRYGYGTDIPHYSKRASHGNSSRSSRGHGYPMEDQNPSPVHRPSSSYPSWYTPEVYTNGRYPQQHSRHEVEHSNDPRSSGPHHYELGSDPSSRPGSPLLVGHRQQALPPMRTGYTPPPPSEAQGRPSHPPHSYRPAAQSLDSHQSQARHEERPPHPDSPTSPGSHSPTPPRVFGPQVDRPIKKSTRPLECSNCMALDSVVWKPKVDVVLVEDPPMSGLTSSANDEDASARSKILCPPCTIYLQTHGKPRPVGPFRANFLKKIHTRFKRELQEVRFQGWQDAQVLEIEDRMSEREFQMVFNGLDDSDASQITSGQVSASGSPAPMSSSALGLASTVVDTTAATTVATSGAASDASELESKEPRDAPSSIGEAKKNDNIAIKIEDDDDDAQALTRKALKPENIEVRTFQSEASVGELFGHRWRTEPVVGYTLVHFGGSDRTRMVPMNPTVPSLTITFNRSEQSITFAFRVLVNGLCLLSSGGGPPALHMPEMADDDESEEDEEEVVVVPDNDKEDQSSPSPPPPMGLATADSGAAQDAASSLALTATPSKEGEATNASEAVDADVHAHEDTPAVNTANNGANPNA
ncbi:hypothetical protein KVV02_000605 [Mortierella alpina]|uniref:Uncharacterized protein n=1 Tax=Mortierella alpina TaxID=64518 RepID=A0A9P7ZZ24_MORAP|nr:hypothetical protein KVV02_000605 [Mortierella alpina]